MTKAEAIRAVLTSAGKPITIDVLLPQIEAKLRQVVGRARLYKLLGVMKIAEQIATSGRADRRAYSWVRQ